MSSYVMTIFDTHRVEYNREIFTVVVN